MTDYRDTLDCDAVQRAVAEVYRAAGFDGPRPTGAVVPLRQLMAAFPLTWYEVPHLTTATSSEHLYLKFGVPREESPVSDDALAGRLYATAAGGCILVEQTHKLVRRRFTVAHELGHYILHVIPRLDAGAAAYTEALLRTRGMVDDDGPSQGRSAIIGANDHVWHIDAENAEREADLFAAEVLMPEPVCRSLLETHYRRCGGKAPVLARLLATECLVSERAMARRLEELHLLGASA